MVRDGSLRRSGKACTLPVHNLLPRSHQRTKRHRIDCTGRRPCDSGSRSRVIVFLLFSHSIQKAQKSCCARSPRVSELARSIPRGIARRVPVSGHHPRPGTLARWDGLVDDRRGSKPETHIRTSPPRTEPIPSRPVARRPAREITIADGEIVAGDLLQQRMGMQVCGSHGVWPLAAEERRTGRDDGRTPAVDRAPPRSPERRACFRACRRSASAPPDPAASPCGRT